MKIMKVLEYLLLMCSWTQTLHIAWFIGKYGILIFWCENPRPLTESEDVIGPIFFLVEVELQKFFSIGIFYVNSWYVLIIKLFSIYPMFHWIRSKYRLKAEEKKKPLENLEKVK